MKNVSFIVFLAVLIGVMSCKHKIPSFDPLEGPPSVSFTCDEDSIYFQEQILPLFQSSCAVPDCHDAASHQEDIILDSYANIINTGEIEAGDLDAGKIYEKITESDPDDIMPPPPYNPLSQDEINLIADWINQGAWNNSCPSALCDTLEVTFSGDIQVLVGQFCEGCHSGGSPQADLSLTNYAQISSIANSGSFVSSLKGEDNFVQMPLNNSLSNCQIRMVEIWIENGAPND
jgi:hypothetical protein